jgi:hypothetical protein
VKAKNAEKVPLGADIEVEGGVVVEGLVAGVNKPLGLVAVVVDVAVRAAGARVARSARLGVAIGDEKQGAGACGGI